MQSCVWVVRLAALFWGCAVAGYTANAATVEVVRGNVSINAGEGFLPVSGSAAAGAGSTVMAAPGAAADIVYENGCKVRVEAGNVGVVSSSPPTCPGGQQFASSNQGLLLLGALAVGGVVAGVAIMSSSEDKPASGQ
ncbi:MAG: hypothetical protein KDJ17_04295 [Hyphomicrobiaceae bacterium]|nr:hypothetical protein [Hyphomicrobiaceae bacterium]